MYCLPHMETLFALMVFYNKANLRDLIAATGLVILLKLDSNRLFFSPCDLEIRWMTQNKANLRDLIAATGLVILLKLDSNRRFFSRETPNLGQNRWFFFSRVTLKFDGWPSKTIGHLFYATSSFVQHFIAIGEFKLELQSGNAQSRSKSTIFLAVWPWNLTDDLQKQ